MAIEGHSKSIRNLIMGDNMSFHVPIYQRSYTWEAKDQVEKLLNDILEFATEYRGNSNGEYYVGNVILKNQSRGFVTERTVIDGQQRITTTILILCALRDLYLEHKSNDDELASARAITRALYIDDGSVRRLKLNNMDHQKTLDRLLSGSLDAIGATDKETRYWENYRHIKKALEHLHKEGDWRLAELPAILERVKVVAIFLDDDQDENSVFESINSAGKPLSGPDLIKNFIFTFRHYDVSRSQEDDLVSLYTEKFESLFTKSPAGGVEAFFREYIAVKTGVKVNENPKIIYYSFKRHVGPIESHERCRQLILELVKWAVIYNTLATGNHPDFDPNDLGYLRASFFTYASLLMDIVDRLGKYEAGKIVIYDQAALRKTIACVVAYDASRFLAGAGQKAITRFVPTIPKILESIDPNFFHDYANAFWTHVSSVQQGYRLPNVAKIREAVEANDIYFNSKQLVRFLILLDNVGKNEQIPFDAGLRRCQIEHIMPQTLGQGWTQINEKDHQRYLHKLGNLSITFDNAKLSNLSFSEKKKKLTELSRVRLNHMLLAYESFGPEQIRDRAGRLLDRFFEAYAVFSDGADYSEREASATVNIFPQKWLDKVRGTYNPSELAGFPVAQYWSEICAHLNVPVGKNSAHRALENWLENYRPHWPSSW